MIDLANEQIRPLARASHDVPGHPHISTLLRWALRGVKGVRLETVIIGGRRFTSLEAIRRFVVRLSEPHPEGALQSKEGRAERVEAELDKAGITASPGRDE
jgi:hypothetical protein